MLPLFFLFSFSVFHSILFLLISTVCVCAGYGRKFQLNGSLQPASIDADNTKTMCVDVDAAVICSTRKTGQEIVAHQDKRAPLKGLQKPEDTANQPTRWNLSSCFYCYGTRSSAPTGPTPRIRRGRCYTAF